MPEQHLLHDQAGFDRLAEAHVVGDEQVHSRHGEGAGHRLELVLLDGDTAAERRLEGLGVGAGHRTPADRIEEGTYLLGVVPIAFCHRWQLGGGDDLAAGFDLPGDGEFVAQVVVADAGESDERLPGIPS